MEETAVVFNPHDNLLQKQTNGTETTNQHAQASLDQGTSRANSDVDFEEEFRRGKL